MKKGLILSVTFGLFCLCLPAASQARPQFEFRLQGGWNNLDGADLNSGSQGRLDYFRTLLNALGYAATGEYSPVGDGPVYGGDIIYWFAKNMGVGIGGGFLSASRGSAMDLSYGSLHLADFDSSVKCRAVPLRLSLFYDLPVSGMISVSLRAGLAYVLAQVDFEEVISGSWPNSTTAINASGGGLGFEGGLGLKLALLRTFGIMVELAGRVADVSGFEGTWSSFTTTEGRLYHFEYITPLGNFPMLAIEPTAPSSPSYGNVREAEVGFSGFSLLIGVFLRL